MRIVAQRVLEASVSVEGKTVSAIGPGCLALVGFGVNDGEAASLERMAHRLVALRIFEDDKGRMNRSLSDIGGELLLVPQFTLMASLEGGHRPSFSAAAGADKARELFDQFAGLVASKHGAMRLGVFQAHMRVSLVNDGPVTLIMDEDAEA